MLQSLLLGEVSQNDYLSMNEITLIYKKLPKKVYGFVFKYKTRNVITINQNISEQKKKMTILHEFAHLELSHLDKKRYLLEFKIEEFDDEAINKTLILNSISIAIIYLLISIAIYEKNAVVNFVPALFYYYINKAIFLNKNLHLKSYNKNKKVEKKNIQKANNIFSITLTILLLLSISLNIFQFLNPKIKIKMKEKIIKEKLNYRVNNDGTVDIEDNNSIIGYVTVNSSQILKLKQKINFYDENIVFVLDGYGNYYYNYDCVQEVTNGKQYSYLAFNKQAAISQGYQEFNCN